MIENCLKYHNQSSLSTSERGVAGSSFFNRAPEQAKPEWAPWINYKINQSISMKKIAILNSSQHFTRSGLFLLLLLLLSLSTKAQQKISPELAQTWLEQKQAELELTTDDIADFVITDQYTDAHNSVTHIYLQQRYQGINIEGGIISMHLKNGTEIIHVSDRFEKRIRGRIASGRNQLSAIEAVQMASRDLGLVPDKALSVVKQAKSAARESLIQEAGIAQRDIPAKLVYQHTETDQLRLVWQVEIYTKDGDHYWQMKVDAANGAILEKRDLVLHCSFGHPSLGPGACTDGHGALNPNAGQRAIEIPFTTAGENLAENTVGNAYRVFNAPFETPNHGNRSLVYTNGDPLASPFGWHHDGLLGYTITKGNNVYAYEDQLGANAGLPAVGGLLPTQPLNFDFPMDLNQDPGTYKDAAVTNLFYWNNLVHDVFYHYGFTEAAGNFQNNNLNKGGLGNDAVMAEAQDGGGTNNANFLTLPDGIPGRMQMYLWSSNQPADLVHLDASPTYPGGGPSFTAIQAAFGTDIDQTGIAGELVIVEANGNAASTCNSCGCGTGQGVGLPPNNDVLGKVVLVDRGDCSFIEKVMGAQLGGAAGVIVVNNIPGEGPAAMGGDETGAIILIPSVMVSFEDGQELKDEIALGAVQIGLRRLTPAPPMKDGDLDNGIITHEYGHGISTRLTGGPSQTCLSGDEQAGEGWSDFFALMMTMDPATLADAGFSGRGIGTYVFDQTISGNGIRPARYARDLTVNDYTYASINNGEITVPHGVGFIFCTALWDMTWNLIDEYGYNPDLVNGSIASGNILAIQLVIDGLKMQPCGPTFLESRDAILAADQALTGGANQCFIWEAFAKRGMGFSAQSGTNARGDEVEAFDMPPACQAAVTISQVATPRVENGGIIDYTIRLTNTGNHRSKKITVTNPIPEYTSYLNGSASPGGKHKSGVVTFSNIRVEGGTSKELTFSVSVNAPVAGQLFFEDDMEDGISKWSSSLGLNSWALADDQTYSGSYSWFAADPDALSNQRLKLAQGITLPAGAELRFRHLFETEADFDGGVVELSTNGGLSWIDLGGQMTRNGYNNFVPAANNLLINGFAFGGSSNGWIETVVNLGLFANQTVKLRYRLSSDVATGGQGWWIDDVIIGKDLTYVENTATFSMPGEDPGTSTVSTLVLEGTDQSRQANFPSLDIPTNSIQNKFTMKAFPNPTRDRVQIRLDQLAFGDIHVEVANLQGQRLIEKDYFANAGSQAFEIDVSNLPSGLYILMAKQNGIREVSRLIIE